MLFGKQISSGFTICKPVISHDIQGILGKDGIAVTTVFTVSNMNAHISKPMDMKKLARVVKKERIKFGLK